MGDSPLGDIESWSQMASPEIGRGAVAIDDDPTKHLVYSANGVFGLWRLRTQ